MGASDCTIDGCAKPVKAKGLCKAHYLRVRRHGSPSGGAPWVDLTDVARFWTKVDKGHGADGCWLWIGEVKGGRYGYFSTYSGGVRARHLAHRYVLPLVGRELTPGLIVMHSCDNPPCVNPAHLQEGSQRDNIRDAMSKGRLDLSGLTNYREQREKRAKQRVSA